MIDRVIKRNGNEAPYKENKIRNAIKNANREVALNERAKEELIQEIIDKINEVKSGVVNIEEIQNFIEKKLIQAGKAELAKKYILYRYNRELIRKANTTDNTILSLVNNSNIEVSEENSNKDAMIASTQRDLIAGEISKDLSRRILLPSKIREAHDSGAIHFHDMDYFLSPIFNCCLVNIKDMFEKGTVMNKKMIESPKSFQVACTVMTQIIASVASGQYGGQSVNIKHLGKYLKLTRDKYRKQYLEDFKDEFSLEQIEKLVEKRVKDELKSGIQTIQYQINTLMTTNGQSPFVTLFLELDPNDEYIDETAQIIEEILKQRIEGVKNEVGIPITPAFPKLIYVLDEHNALKGGKYDYITKKAVECSSKRMYPDYISAKKMRETYEGNVFSPMGCVYGKEKVIIKYDETFMIEFEEWWNELVNQKAKVEKHENGEFIRLKNVKIFDRGNLVDCKGIIRNKTKIWYNLTFDNGSILKCTPDHPLPVKDKGRVFAEDLVVGDTLFQEKLFAGNLNDFKSIKHIEIGIKLINIEVVKLEKEEYSYDVTTETDRFDISGISSHNCRSFLNPYKDKNGEYKFEGRFNQGVVSLNLPQIALETEGNEEKFWELLDERLGLCYEALMVRHNKLKGITSDVSPIHWQYGAIARLKKGETIDKLLMNSYSTISLGYIGVYETSYLVTGESHTKEKGEKFALKLVQKLRDATEEWKRKTNIGFGLYGTPAESLCYRFASIDREKYGSIKNVTDKGYYTNSYHVDVRENINAFDKLNFESQFQPISSSGCISYIEIPNMSKNLDALETMVNFIYDNIQYAEVNTKSDYCHNCGFDQEIIINKDKEWECPQCGNKDHKKMSVTRRTCFTKDNLVFTNNGHKSIADIQVGDKVLTKNNRFMAVGDKDTFEEKETLYIKTPCADEIHATLDHPFFVKTMGEHGFTLPYYKKAEDLTSDDYLLSHLGDCEDCNKFIIENCGDLSVFNSNFIKDITRIARIEGTKYYLFSNDREEIYGFQWQIGQTFKKASTIEKKDDGYELVFDITNPEIGGILIEDDFICSPVLGITKGEKEKVYSLTVVEDSSYTVQGTIVKNCGYLGENFWNKGKTKEISKRVLHIK